MEKFKIPHWRDELYLESLVAEQEFNGLLDDAIETCLSSHEAFDEAYAAAQEADSPVGTEESLARKLGLWGMRAAFDIQRYPDEFSIMTHSAEKEDDTDIMYLGGDTALKAPHTFGYARNPEIVSKIEAFGTALLDEAFPVLGEDAVEKANELKEVQTVEAQWEIIIWLIRRIYEIRKAGLGEHAEEENDHEDMSQQEFYHPLQLSPKAIGSFPEINIEPTCLGVSVLVSSFLEKAGLEHLHAGLVNSDDNDARTQYMDTIRGVKETVETWEMELPDALEQKLDATQEELDQALRLDRGHHALNYVRMGDGRWCQLDINFSSYFMFPQGESKPFEATYKLLQDMRGVAPGLELAQHKQYYSATLMPALLAKNGLVHSKQMDVIAEELRQMPDSTTPDELIDTYVYPVFFGPNEKSYVQTLQKDIWRSLGEIWMDPEESCPFSDEYFRETAKEALLQYVFPDAKDGDIAPCLERCKRDKAYAARRVEDLKLLPLIVNVKVAAGICNATIEGRFALPHTTAEVGLGAYRIGASVLSDFSAHFNALPPSFWATYWPSQVSVVDHLQQPITKASANVVHDVGGSMLTWDMVNPVIHDIIYKFFEQETSSEGEENGGNQPE